MIMKKRIKALSLTLLITGLFAASNSNDGDLLPETALARMSSFGSVPTEYPMLGGTDTKLIFDGMKTNDMQSYYADFKKRIKANISMYLRPLMTSGDFLSINAVVGIFGKPEDRTLDKFIAALFDYIDRSNLTVAPPTSANLKDLNRFALSVANALTNVIDAYLDSLVYTASGYLLNADVAAGTEENGGIPVKPVDRTLSAFKQFMRLPVLREVT